MRNVNFRSETDILTNVYFTAESGHQKPPYVTFGRSSSGSLAIFAAIRRASSLVSSLAAERRPGSSPKNNLLS